MKTFLAVCLLLGVTAVFLIPSACGLKCVRCISGTIKKENKALVHAVVAKDCADYKKDSSEYEQTCVLGLNQSKVVCAAIKMEKGEEKLSLSGCSYDDEIGCRKDVDLFAKYGEDVKGEVCTCDTDLCNSSPRMTTTMGGPGFGGLIMFLLGGVGLIWGQIVG